MMKKVPPDASKTSSPQDFGLLDRYATLLDSKIKVPGTKWTFGIDPIIGLIPGVGSAAGYGMSVMLIYTMLKYGASKRLVLKMMGNVVLDSMVGAIPVAGTIFDFVYKANDRNVRLFKEYQHEGKHAESVLPFFIGLIIATMLLLFLIIWMTWSIGSWVLEAIGSMG